MSLSTIRSRASVFVMIVVRVLPCAMAQSPNQNPWGPFLRPVDADTVAWKRSYVEGFVWPTSIKPGDQLSVYVSVKAWSDSQSYDMEVFRVDHPNDQVVLATSHHQGQFFPLYDSVGMPIYPGERRRPVDYQEGCRSRWQPGMISLSTGSWAPGFYYIRLTHSTLPQTHDEKEYYISFVVKPSSPGASDVLCKVDLSTYQAYNYWGGGSFYWDYEGSSLAWDSIIAMDRPLFRSWAFNLYYQYRLFVRVADSLGFPMDFCTNADVDRSVPGSAEDILSPYPMLLIWNHDEYWSFDERINTEWFKSDRHHGNLARFAPNTCYRRVYWVGGGGEKYSKLKCVKDHYTDLRDQWRMPAPEDPTSRPEAQILAIQYENGYNIAGDSIATEPPDSLVADGHWIYRGTGLTQGSLFGFGFPDSIYQRGIVSYELDNRNTGQDSVRLVMQVLARRSAVSNLGSGQFGPMLHEMVYAEDTVSNSRIFASGAGNWWNGFDPRCTNATDVGRIVTITRNIFDHFSGRKYIGNVYGSPQFPIEWLSGVILDGDVTIPTQKYLRTSSNTITIDTSYGLYTYGTLEVSGSVHVEGTAGAYGELYVGAGGRLLIKQAGILNIDPAINLVLAPGATVELEGGATLTISSGARMECLGSPTLVFGSGSKIEAWGGVELADTTTVSLPSNADVRMKPGSGMYFGWGARLLSHGAFTATGSVTANVLFTSSRPSPVPGDWQWLDLKGGPNTLRHCEVKYSQGGVYFNNTSTNLLDSCTVKYSSGYAVQAFNSSLTPNSVLIRDCLIESNTYGATVQNGRIDIVQNSSTNGIRANEFGINVWAGGKVYLNNTYITNNTDWGIYVNGSTAYACLSPNGISPGLNRVRDNSDGQIWVLTGNVLLGNTDMTCRCDPVYGESTRLDEKQSGSGGIETNCIPPCYSAFLQYAGYNRISGPYPWVKNETGASVLARLNYWGNPQQCPLTSPSLAFPGPGAVDYQFCQTGGGENWLAGKGDGGCEPQIENLLDSTLIRALIESLKDELVSGTVRARPSLHQLASLCGVGGQFSSLLPMDWRNLLDHVLTRNVSADIKNLVRAYRLQDMMDKKLFDQAITYANTISSIQDDELWFHAQSTIVYALVAMGQAEQANARYQTIKGRAAGINPTATAHLEYFLGMQAGSQGSPGEGLAMAVSGDVANDRPSKTVLDGNYPNPFNPTTTIGYELPVRTRVMLNVFTTLGQHVATLVEGEEEAGHHHVQFDATGLASGVYLCRMQAGSFVQTRKLMLLR